MVSFRIDKALKGRNTSQMEQDSEKSAANKDLTLDSVRFYSHYAEVKEHIYPSEALLFSRCLQKNNRVLDLGCGTGRVCRELVRLGMDVYACDLDPEAIKKIPPTTPPISLCVADARELPYEDGFFDAVIFAYSGIDYLNPETERIKVIKEIERVLKPKGWFMFSSHNSIGEILSPRFLRCLKGWTWRIRSLLNLNFLKRYAADPNGLVLFHAPPSYIIKQTEESGDFRFEYGLDRTARVQNRLLLTLFASWPYYLFRKK